MSEENKTPEWAKGDKYEFIILATDLAFWKGHKETITKNKKEDEDFWDFLNHNIASTDYPSPVMLSKRELKELFEVIPGSIEKIAFYRKVLQSEKENEAPFGEHIEISRKDFDEAMAEPDVVSESIMSKEEMEKLAKQMAKEFGKEAAKNGLSKEEVDKLVKKALNDKIAEMESNLAKMLSEQEKTRKKEEEEKTKAAEAKVKAALAEQAKEMVEEKAKAKLAEKLKNLNVGKENGNTMSTDRTAKDVAKDAARFASDHVLHGVKQAVASESAKIVVDGLKKAFENEPVILGFLDHPVGQNFIIAIAAMALRTISKETNLFPESVKGGVDEISSLILQSSGKDVVAPMLANLRPLIIDLAKQGQKMVKAQEQGLDVLAISDADLDLDVAIEEEVAAEEEAEKKETRVKRAGRD